MVSNIINSLSRIFSVGSANNKEEAEERTSKDFTQGLKKSTSSTEIWYRHPPRSRTVRNSLKRSTTATTISNHHHHNNNKSFHQLDPEAVFHRLSFSNQTSVENNNINLEASKENRQSIMFEDSGYNTPNNRTLDDGEGNDAMTLAHISHNLDDGDLLKSLETRRSSGSILLSSGEKFGTGRLSRSRTDSGVGGDHQSTTSGDTNTTLSSSRSRERKAEGRGMSPTFSNSENKGTHRPRSRRFYSPFPKPPELGHERSLSLSRSAPGQSGSTGIPEALLLGDYSMQKKPLRISGAESLLALPPSLQMSEENDDKFYYSTLAQEIRAMVDENVNQIMEDGSNEFNTKYAKWIQQVFHLQLDKLHSRLKQAFTQEVSRMAIEKEEEIMKIQQSYRQRLLDLESSTEKFQHWFDTLSEENQRLAEYKHQMTMEMKYYESDQRRQWTAELEKQASEIEAKGEQEKMELQKLHVEQLGIVRDKCKEQVNNLEVQYKHQIDSLTKLVEELKDQNASLTQNLELCKTQSNVVPAAAAVCMNKYPKDREKKLLTTIHELREQLAIAEKEKTMILLAHNNEIVQLHKELEGHHKQISTQIRTSRGIIDEMNRQRDDDIAEMRERLQAKDKEYQAALNALRLKYGTKISELTETVVDLQKRLIRRSK